MGTEYDLISDKARVGYELGKGPWHDLSACLRSDDPRRDVIALMKIQGCFSDEAYCAEVADEIVKFIKEHPDWRVIDEYSSDIWVATDEDIAEEAAEFDEGINEDAYRKIGSRYRETAPSDESPMAIEGAQDFLPADITLPSGTFRAKVAATDVKAFVQRQAEQFARRAQCLAFFAPSEIAPGETLTFKVVRASVISTRDGRRWMDSFSECLDDRIEVFRPTDVIVAGDKTDDGLIVESVKVAGRDQLAGPASSMIFEGQHGVSMDSGKLSEFEIVVTNPGETTVKVTVRLEGMAMLAAPSSPQPSQT